MRIRDTGFGVISADDFGTVPIAGLVTIWECQKLFTVEVYVERSGAPMSRQAILWNSTEHTCEYN